MSVKRLTVKGGQDPSIHPSREIVLVCIVLGVVSVLPKLLSHSVESPKNTDKFVLYTQTEDYYSIGVQYVLYRRRKAQPNSVAA